MARKTIAGKCGACGWVGVPGDRVTVVEAVEGPGRWGFTCPRCSRDVWHPSCPEAVRVLVEAGATVIPASQDPARSLPGFTEADVEAFAAVLARLDTAPDVAYGQPRITGGPA